MTQTARRAIARLAIALLLYMQFALVAYACPRLAVVPAPSPAVAEMHGDCCPSLDPADPNLCLEHSHRGSQAHGQTAAPMPLAVDLPMLTMVPAVLALAAPAWPAVPTEFLAHCTAPPPAIAFGQFRS